MNWILLLLALVMIACILCNKLTSKIGMPVLLAFLAVGSSAAWTVRCISASTTTP